MSQGLRGALGAFVVAMAAAMPAAAGPAATQVASHDERPGSLRSILSEIRGGVLYHDAGLISDTREASVDVNAEVLFTSPEIFKWILSPRPHLGGSLNTEWRRTSHVYAGLSWTWYPIDEVFIEFSLGGSVHNGELDAGLFSNGKSYGCRVLFRESLSLGYQFDEHHNISVMLDHISNAGLCFNNDGIDTLGIRYGYRF